jgi:chromosome condensin MukBEF MukE localization factor
VAKDTEIRNRIDELVQEEHDLWEAESRGDGSDIDRRRLREIKVTLDRCWDLLRQRRALEEWGLDADAARVRPADVVENYEQ